jgi:hypothetical protein
MADEPALQKGQSGEWVKYLQQVMAHNQFWSGDADGEFGDDLEAAVIQVQQLYGVTADGVVRAATWAILTGESATSATPADHGLRSTGARASEDSESSVGGLPAFSYNLPSIPLAEARFDTPEAHVEVALTLRGDVTITFPNAPAGITLDQEGWRLQAQTALHGVTEGLEVDGIGSGSPSISATFGNEFHQTGLKLTPPNKMSFTGQSTVSYEIQCEHTEAHVEGSVEYELEVEVTPHRQSDPAPTDEHSWLSRHSGTLLGVGALALVVVVAVALAPETGGGSLLLAAPAL